MLVCDAEDFFSEYLHTIDQIPVLTPEEERELAHRIVAGDAEAAGALVVAYLRLVVSLARRHASSGVPLDDLVQEGNIGLLRAVRTFDWQPSARFSTYAVCWIRQAIQHEIRHTGRSIRLPLHAHATACKLHRTEQRLKDELAREPTQADLASAVGLSVAEIDRILQAERPVVSLEAPTAEKGNLCDILADDRAQTVDHQIELCLLRATLAQLMSEHLNEREHEVLTLRFGLDGGGPMPLAEVGVAVGLTRKRTRQIEATALRKLWLSSRHAQLTA